MKHTINITIEADEFYTGIYDFFIKCMPDERIEEMLKIDEELENYEMCAFYRDELNNRRNKQWIQI